MKLLVNVIEAKDLVGVDSTGSYCVSVKLWNVPSAQKQKTNILKQPTSTNALSWNDQFHFDCRDALESLDICVWAHHRVRPDEQIATARFNLSSIHLPPGELIDIWIPLATAGKIHLAFQREDKPAASLPPVFMQPSSINNTLPPFNPAFFLPPPASHGSVPGTPSQTITFEVSYQMISTGVERLLSLHGLATVITPDLVAAINNVIKNTVQKGPPPLLKQNRLHWEAEITPDVQAAYQEDIIAGLLNLFELWSWRFEKQYDVVKEIRTTHDEDGGSSTYTAHEIQVLVFRRAVNR